MTLKSPELCDRCRFGGRRDRDKRCLEIQWNTPDPYFVPAEPEQEAEYAQVVLCQRCREAAQETFAVQVGSEVTYSKAGCQRCKKKAHVMTCMLRPKEGRENGECTADQEKKVD